MADEMQVERELILEGDVAEVWPLLSTPEGWQQWLVDEVHVDGALVEGTVGAVDDDGVSRRLHVTHVEEERSLTFQWWEGDDPSSASEVFIEVSPLVGGGSHLRISERALGLQMSVRASSAWEVRALLLTLTQCTLARV